LSAQEFAERPRGSRDRRLHSAVHRLLAQRGVKARDVAEVVYEIQHEYYPDLTVEECLLSVKSVMEKREVQHAILTGLTLDVLAEEGRLPEPLQGILRSDDSLYGVDEVLALSITNVYGSIGLTNFGYLDKQKLGILGELNRRKEGEVHTFLDDLLAGVAAAAAAKIAHQRAR